MNIKKISKYVVPVCMGMMLFTGCNVNEDDKIEDFHNNKIEEQTNDIVKISINAFGDLLIHNSIYGSAKSGDTYNFNKQFESIKDKVIDADYTIGNLEVPIGKSDFSNYPSFRAPWQVAQAMKDVLDVELLATASNHTLDKGFKGLKTTLDCLDEIGIKHVGSYRTEDESNDILIEDINGARVAIVAYTYGTNGYPIPKDNPKAVNLINKEKIKLDTSKAKELGADFIIVKIHWGEEYQLDENSSQKELAKFIFEETDANLIIGDHPHVVQNIEEMTVTRNGVDKKGTVIYSLGNFISGQNKKYRDTGIIVKSNIVIDKKNPENTKVENVEYTPVFVDRNSGAGLKKHRVVDINTAIKDYEDGTDTLISSDEYKKMVEYRDYYREKLIQDDFVFEK